MLKVLNRMAWILAVAIWISISGIDDDLIIFGIVSIFWIKFFLSEDFIKSHILEYNRKFEESIVKKLSLTSWMVPFSENKETIPELTNSIDEMSLNKEEERLEDIATVEYVKKYYQEEPQEKLNNESIPSYETEKNEPKEPGKVAKFLSEFFAENLMAKIGWILLTLWIIFLMSLVYSAVGPVMKIIIGFAVGFVVYFIGTLLEKKWLKTEGIILLGTWILINYCVILGGRFVIGDNDGYLSSGITFVLLLLNTAFSVLTSYIYNSKNLLLFSIFFSYLIPFLVGSSGSQYSYLVVVGYSVILSFGTLFISNQKYQTGDYITAKILFYFSVILGNILILVSPLNSEFSFITKLVGFNIITFSNIFLAYKNKFSSEISGLFASAFVFLALILWYGVNFLGGEFNHFNIFITYLISILGIIWGMVFFITAGIGSGIVYLLFAPLLIILGLLFSGSLFGGIFLIPIFLIIYLVIFSLILSNLVGNIFKYVFFGILWAFIVICNGYFAGMDLIVDMKNFISIIATGFLFLISTYYLSSKKDLSYLYTIGTLASIFILLPVLKITGEFTQISVLSVIAFWIINYLTPFINSNLVKNDSKNLVLWNIFWVLFIGGNLFRFGNENFPWMTLGISFFALAVLYFAGWFLLFSKFEKQPQADKEANINFIYTFLAIAVSLFSIAVALVFSKLPLVIAFIWLVESSIVFFFAQKLNARKVFIAGIILFIIGLIKYASLALMWLANSDLVAIGLITISLFLNVFFIRNATFEGKNFIKVLHLIGMFMVYGSTLQILNDHAHSGKIFVFSGVFLGVLGIIYNILKDTFLKKAFIWLFILLFIGHIGDANSVGNYNNNYIFTVIALLVLVIEYAFFKDKYSKWLALSYWLYFFIITSMYLYHATNDAFSLTIYWGILSLTGVHIWLGNSNKYIRATGLYLLIITLLKISFYDIWNNLDNPIMRVIALMFVGWIMMYISTLYSKNKLSIKDDFDFSIWEEKEWDTETKTVSEEKSEININETIKNIDVSDIESVKFNGNNKKNFTIKSKNLFKIVVMITTSLKKTSFKAGELQEIYDTVVQNYTSELSEADYKKVLWVIKDFVEVGGNVEINKK